MTNYQKAITLDLSQIGESAQAKIKHKLAFKAPTKRGDRSENTSLDTPMHVNADGKLSLFPEKHANSLLAMKRRCTRAPDPLSHPATPAIDKEITHDHQQRSPAVHR